MRIDLKVLDRINNGSKLALQHGKGTLLVVDAAQKDYYFSTYLVDKETGLAYGPPEPNLFLLIHLMEHVLLAMDWVKLPK